MKLQELLGKVAFPETPEDRDEAESAIRAMLAEAWDEGNKQGYLEGADQDLIQSCAPNPYIMHNDDEGDK